MRAIVLFHDLRLLEIEKLRDVYDRLVGDVLWSIMSEDIYMIAALKTVCRVVIKKLL